MRAGMAAVDLDALAELREEIDPHLSDLRNRAAAVDAHPEDMGPHLGSPGVRAIHRLGQLPGEPGSGRCLYLVALLMAACRGDAGVVLACPGPSVAGVVFDLLADDRQRSLFRDALADGRSWAFCAVTEPQVGSDAFRIRTELRRDGTGGYLLSGAKRYVGNASRGSIGIVFARTGTSPLAVRAVLVRAPTPGLHGEALDMAGLRGARIGELTFRNVPVEPTALLGEHLPISRRGLWGAVGAFNSVRVQVGAMALGTAEAVLDYVCDEAGLTDERRRDELAAARIRIEVVRRLLYGAAVEVDAERGRGHLASLAKLEAVQLVQDLSARLPRLLGRGALLDHPLLEKWRRDAQGFEFMEGTSDIQRLNVAQGALRQAGGWSG